MNEDDLQKRIKWNTTVKRVSTTQYKVRQAYSQYTYIRVEIKVHNFQIEWGYTKTLGLSSIFHELP